MKKLISLIAGIVLSVSLFGANFSPIFAQAQDYKQGIVQTTQFGKIQGTKNQKSLVWEGVPYAKAPIGDLRWKALADTDAWTGIKITNKEVIATQLSKTGAIGGDDSLNLTIYRPDTKEVNLPILVYIHGGNNQTGKSTEFDSTILSVKLNAVVITINHRLDILGFNPLPALKTGNALEDSGNYALLDINKALDWIIANAKVFGGNSDNITISGFSAGGRDILAILASPIFKGKFKQAISFSGGITLSDPQISREIYAQKLSKFVLEDKIKTNEKDAVKWLLGNSKEVRDYLYSLSSERLVLTFGNGNIRMAGFPHLFADGVVLPKEGSKTTKFNSVPLILLDSGSEFSIFAVNDPYFAKNNKEVLLKDEKIKQELAWTIKYGSLLYKYANVEDVVKTIYGKYKSDIYSVKIDWGTDEGIVGQEFAQLWGAHHGIFLPLLTEKPILTSALFPKSFTSKGVKEAGAALQQYIKNFIWDGNPNGQNLVQWKPWGKTPNQLIINADAGKANIYESSQIIDQAEVIAQIANDKSIDEQSKKIIISQVLNGRWFSKDLDKKFKNAGVWVTK
ncbi:MAG: carboxylesterase family protein [Elusimicrobiota bacterium]|jgi:para-nitrobenzyl esterase|nr:carboxylesterase family protein [Elusimicrobiota bacterium]